MNNSQQQGLCPSCDEAGTVGSPCGEKVCAKRGYRYLPAEYHAKIAAASAGTQDPVVGQLIDDYLVVDVLGAGGFGTVYMALQQPIQLRAALKLMNLRADPTLAEIMIEKFRAEAAALASLSHPNVVRLLKYGRFGDMPYLVMEFVEGARTLKDEIAARAVAGGTLHINDTARIIIQCLNALEAAHERAIVHRDIKPDNIMLQKVSGDPHFVRVLDFGLAKFVDQRTLTSTTVGTPVYMAPEQLTKGRIGPWTDLYALGIVAFEMLTGLSPFPGDSQQAILTKKVDPSYSPTSRLSERDMPAYMVRFFQRAIARDPQERFQNASEFRAEFAQLHAAMGGDSGLSTVTDVREIVDEVALIRARRSMAAADIEPFVGLGSADTGLASAPTGLSTGPAWVHDETLAQAPLPGPASGTQSHATQSPTPKKRSPWPFVGVGVAVALAASAILVVATNGSSDDEAQRGDKARSDVEAGVVDKATQRDLNRGAASSSARSKVTVAPAAAPTLAPAQAKAMQLKTLMLVAEEHLNKRRWQDALTAFGEARVREPSNEAAKAGFSQASAEKSRMTAVAKAASAMDRGDLAAVEAALAEVGDTAGSVYAPDVALLTTQVRDMRTQQAASAKQVPGTGSATAKPHATPAKSNPGKGSGVDPVHAFGKVPAAAPTVDPAVPTKSPQASAKPASVAEQPAVAPVATPASSAPKAAAIAKPVAATTTKSAKASKNTKGVAPAKPSPPEPGPEQPAETTPKTKPGTHVKIDRLERASKRMKGRLKRLTECKPPKVQCSAIRNACVSEATCKRMMRLKRKQR